MSNAREWKIFAAMAFVFGLAYYLPLADVRVTGAIVFAFVVGLGMALIFRREEEQKERVAAQLPEAPPSERRGWQSALLLACMVGFLIFSDWFNPGDAAVRRTDGTEVRGVVLQEMRDEVMIQVQESVDGHRAGDRVVLRKSQIDEIVRAETWIMAVHGIRWYLAGMMGLAVVLMTWRWVRCEEFQSWMGNTWSFSKLLVPIKVMGMKKTLVFCALIVLVATASGMLYGRLG